MKPMLKALAIVLLVVAAGGIFYFAELASLPVAEALANAPDRRGDFYGVPAVLD